MGKRTWAIVVVAAASIHAGQAMAADGSPANGGAVEFFERKVRPILVDNCYNCHSANTNAKGGLRVDDRNGLVHGGNTGAAIVPGHPEKSLLIKAVGYDDDSLQMPPKKQLSAEQVAVLSQWIKEGAAWPQEIVQVEAGKSNAKYERLRKEHWAWQPIRSATTPEVRTAAWVRDDIDRFVLAKLEEKGLAPVNDAGKLALIRRVTFDLTGLPPVPADVEAYLKDGSPDAFAKVVDRLLVSPAFGERWGRHWLDVARYGESTGSSRNVPYPQAWRYRDYVIDAFNADRPYDVFLREQIAGDLLAAESAEQRDRQRVATGFLALGVKDVNQRFKVRFVMDNIDEQIDTVSRSTLALTASCARCHDHKFDPIPTSDYYALAGIFNSTDLCAGVRNKMGGGGLDYYDTQMLLTLGEAKAAAPSEKVAELQKAYEKAKAEWDAIRGTPRGQARGPDGLPTQRPYRLRMEKLQSELLALTDPAKVGQVALGVRDAKAVGDTEIRVRGEAEKLGPSVPRGFLSVLDVAGTPKVNPEQSGRLELAQWITSPRNPLTPRVMANRVWAHLFGQGLVKTVDNFGTTGDVPSHPELLDHLAARFVDGGWSVKRLVRGIVLSHAYQLSSEESPANLAADPGNRLVWRHSPRRLEAEEIRDATLAANGNLKATRPDGSPANQLQVRELRNNGPEARRFEELARGSAYRSVYLPLLRGLTPDSLEVFDFAEQGMVTGSRDATTVATQALYLLNDPFVRRQSLALADRLLGRTDLDDAARVDQAYRLTLGRGASATEIQRARAYVSEFEVASRNVVQPIANAASEPEVVVASATGDAGTGTSAADAASQDAAQATAAAETAGGGKGKRKKAGAEQAQADAIDAQKPKVPAAAVNVDEAVPVEAPVKEDVVTASNPKAAAWASFCQALLGSAEFRYLK